MSTEIEKLLALQEKDRELRLVRLDLEEIPRSKEQLLSRLEKQRQLTEAAQAQMNRLNTENRELEADVDMSREKIARYRRQQMETNNSEAVRTLESEIRTFTRHVRDAEDRQIELMERMESQTEILDAQNEALDNLIKEVAVEQAGLEEQEQRQSVEAETLQSERDALNDGISSELYSKYNRIFEHVGDFAVVKANGATCHGCRMQLPPSLVLESKNSETVTTCNYCGRILYFEK